MAVPTTKCPKTDLKTGLFKELPDLLSKGFVKCQNRPKLTFSEEITHRGLLKSGCCRSRFYQN